MEGRSGIYGVETAMKTLRRNSFDESGSQLGKKLMVQLLLSICFITLVVSSGWAKEPLEAAVTPPVISIGTFYDGTQVEVNGFIPAQCEAVVRITGKTSELHLRKKGKALGLLWMNLDTLTIENVPNVYLLYVPDDFDQLAKSNPVEKPVAQLTFAALEKQITMLPESNDKDALFKEFLKLKQSEGLYAESKGCIHYRKESDGVRSFQADLRVPSRLTPGEYKIDLYAVKGGEIIAHTEQGLPVKLEGLPAMLSSLAFQHGALYGVLATLAALLAGLLMGFFFGGGKGGH